SANHNIFAAPSHGLSGQLLCNLLILVSIPSLRVPHIPHSVTICACRGQNGDPSKGAQVAACPDSWIGYLGKCYYFSEAEGNWTYSQSHCSGLNASLAGIDTQQEMDFLMNHKGPSDHWIGLGREPDQPWMWTNSTEFNKWFPIAGGGLCAFLNRGDVSSSSCWRNARWICSKAAEKPAGRAK
uniref:C-type lectin domain-containing protein n=1 Tax=Gopherus evgoodei TaxID=1825980 RepID=A0A8C4W3Q2_9SAUR